MEKINLDKLASNHLEIKVIAEILYNKMKSDNKSRCEFDSYLGHSVNDLVLPNEIHVLNILNSVISYIGEDGNFNLNYINGLNVRPYIYTDLNDFFVTLVFKRQNENKEQIYASIQEMELAEIILFLSDYNVYHTPEEYFEILRFSLSVIFQKDNFNEEDNKMLALMSNEDIEKLYKCILNDINGQKLARKK